VKDKAFAKLGYAGETPQTQKTMLGQEGQDDTIDGGKDSQNGKGQDRQDDKFSSAPMQDDAAVHEEKKLPSRPSCLPDSETR